MVGVQSLKPIPYCEGGANPGFWRILSKFDLVYINSSFKYSICYMFDNNMNRTYKFIGSLYKTFDYYIEYTLALALLDC